MKCPRCGVVSRVIETREHKGVLSRRVRECFNEHRFSTVELPLAGTGRYEFERINALLTTMIDSSSGMTQKEMK